MTVLPPCWLSAAGAGMIASLRVCAPRRAAAPWPPPLRPSPSSSARTPSAAGPTWSRRSGPCARRPRRRRRSSVVVDHDAALLARARASSTGRARRPAQRARRGLAGARNTAFASASGEVLAFLDDDAVAEPDWLERLLAAYDDPRRLGAGGAVRPRWDGGRPPGVPAGVRLGRRLHVPRDARGRRAGTERHRRNMSFRRAVIDELGAFRLGYGCEETEFCMRARRRWPDDASVRPGGRRPPPRPGRPRAVAHFRSRCFFEGRSKAVVSWLQGRQDALASERRYTLVTIPRGIVREVATFGRTGDVDALRRAGAIAAGLAITTAGYATAGGSASTPRRTSADSSPTARRRRSPSPTSRERRRVARARLASRRRGGRRYPRPGAAGRGARCRRDARRPRGRRRLRRRRRGT